MKATFPPFGNSIFAVHGCIPTHFQTLHESFQEAEVDDIVFDDEDVDGRDSAVEETTKLWRMLDGLL